MVGSKSRRSGFRAVWTGVASLVITLAVLAAGCSMMDSSTEGAACACGGGCSCDGSPCQCAMKKAAKAADETAGKAAEGAGDAAAKAAAGASGAAAKAADKVTVPPSPMK